MHFFLDRMAAPDLAEQGLKDCEALMDELSLQQESARNAAKAVNTLDPFLDINKQKERLLIAQIELLKEQKVCVEPEYTDLPTIKG